MVYNAVLKSTFSDINWAIIIMIRCAKLGVKRKMRNCYDGVGFV